VVVSRARLYRLIEKYGLHSPDTSEGDAESEDV
jgi:hypothetical protein